jgi:peptidoglycan/xylan/chitin deacetylase (PgdA/CDA1 family)
VALRIERKKESMLSKRDYFAKLCYKMGLTKIMTTLPASSCLIILNYHRIGEAEKCPFDSGVFSATGKEFDDQMSFLNSTFDVIDVRDLLNVVDGSKKLLRPSVLITFDDGYLDNYELAYPILRSLGLPAVFFLPTHFVGTSELPWWDQIAYLVKTTPVPVIRMDYPYRFEIALQDTDRNAVVQQLLRVYKSPSQRNSELFIQQLEHSCEKTVSTARSRLFLNWNEAADMLRNGMSVGSHTHSHSLLGKLSVEEQNHELGLSKKIIEENLGIECETLAYPVGKPGTFSTETQEQLRRTGYKAAFSFYGGINQNAKLKRYDIMRVPVDAGRTRERFEFQMNFAALTGSYWF